MNNKLQSQKSKGYSYPQRIKKIPWIKFHPDELDSIFMKEFMAEHRDKSLRFWLRLNQILADNFDLWNPGCLRIKREIFFRSFRIDRRTVVKMLNFCMDKYKIFHKFDGDYIIIFYPEFEELTQNYRTQRIKKDAKKNVEMPENAQELLTFCKVFASNFTANKGNKPALVPTPLSSLMDLSNNHETNYNVKEREEGINNSDYVSDSEYMAVMSSDFESEGCHEKWKKKHKIE